MGSETLPVLGLWVLSSVVDFMRGNRACYLLLCL